jgi:hypothetical protein
MTHHARGVPRPNGPLSRSTHRSRDRVHRAPGGRHEPEEPSALFRDRCCRGRRGWPADQIDGQGRQCSGSWKRVARSLRYPRTADGGEDRVHPVVAQVPRRDRGTSCTGPGGRPGTAPPTATLRAAVAARPPNRPGVVKPRDPILAGRDRPAGPPTDRVIPTDLGHGRPPASSRGAGMRAASSGATSVQERAQRVPVDAGAGGELQGESRRSRQASTSEVAQGQVAHP